MERTIREIISYDYNMNAGAGRVFKKGVGDSSTGSRCFNKTKQNSPGWRGSVV